MNTSIIYWDRFASSWSVRHGEFCSSRSPPSEVLPSFWVDLRCSCSTKSTKWRLSKVARKHSVMWLLSSWIPSSNPPRTQYTPLLWRMANGSNNREQNWKSAMMLIRWQVHILFLSYITCISPDLFLFAIFSTGRSLPRVESEMMNTQCLPIRLHSSTIGSKWALISDRLTWRFCLFSPKYVHNEFVDALNFTCKA